MTDRIRKMVLESTRDSGDVVMQATDTPEKTPEEIEAEERRKKKQQMEEMRKRLEKIRH